MALARTTETFWYGAAAIDAVCGAAGAQVVRSAAIRSSTYCVTWTRISRPVMIDHHFGIAEKANLPNINVSGKSGANAISRPPNPHPMSANSGVLPLSAKAGKCMLQSIA